MKTLLKVVGVALGLLLLLLSVIIARALLVGSRQVVVTPAQVSIADPAAAAERLAGAIRFQTISYQDATLVSTEAFDGLHAYLAEQFPLVHARLDLQRVGGYTLLYKWTGSDPALKPILLMAHQDVVPIQQGTEADWEHEPFSGDIDGTYVWGRGTLDDKGNLLGTLEAVEKLLSEGAAPRRTVYLSFGHDEEIGGEAGAKIVAQMLKEQGIELEFVLDEGSAMTQGLVPGVDKRIALVGVAEKGYVTLKLEVEDQGGHSSMPPPQTALGKVAAAASRVETNPMPGGLEGLSADMFGYIGPEMDFPMRAVFANLWLFRGMIEGELSKGRTTNAVLRTTTALTMMEGSNKENILPAKAHAMVNFRVHPRDTIDDVIKHVEDVVDDPEVKISHAGKQMINEPSPVSRTDSESFQMLATVIREQFPDAVVAPSLVLGGTDAKHFSELSPNVYRFGPQTMTNDDLKRIHGTNERIAISIYADTINFYYHLLKRVAM